MKKLLSFFAPTMMVLSPLAGSGGERAIEREVVVPAGVAAVWEAWTTREGIISFFAPGAEVELRVGGPFQIYFDPLAAPGSRGADDMVILAYQQERMLSFTWNAPPHLAEARKQRTHVVVRLHAMGEAETRVTLRHDGWGDGGEWDQAYTYFTNSWPIVLGNLQRRFAEGPIDWTEWMEQLRKHHAK